MEVTKKLKLPPAADKGIWKGIDEDLVMITSSLVASDNKERLELTERNIYSYLEARFGEDPKKFPQKKTLQRESYETKAIRISKRQARRRRRRILIVLLLLRESISSW